MTRLDSERADAWLCAALLLSRNTAVSPERFDFSVQALMAALAEEPHQPFPMLAIDVAHLLSGARLEPLTQPVPDGLKDALRAYEDHLLARLVADRRWNALADAHLAASPDLRPVAAGLLVSQLLTRLGVKGPGVSQAAVRRLSRRPLSELLADGRGQLRAQAADLSAGLNNVARAARRSRDLLTDAEVFLLENVAALKGLGSRVALGQVAEAAQALEEQLPVRVKTSFSEGDAKTDIEEEASFPVGGFSSISTVGTLENLVTSELIYMDEAQDRPDLFDLRFVEGELLYYARDESVAVRRRRRLVLLLDSSLDLARTVDSGEKFQRLVWAMAAVVAVVRRLSAWLDAEALTFEIVFLTQGKDNRLADELGVLSLLLREFRERGHLEVREATDAAHALEQAQQGFRGRLQSVVFTAAAEPVEGVDGQVWVDVEAGLSWQGAEPVAASGRSASSGWASLARVLLERLLGQTRGAKAA